MAHRATVEALETARDALHAARHACFEVRITGHRTAVLADVTKYLKVGIVVKPMAMYDDAPDAVPALMAQNIDAGRLTATIHTRIRREAHVKNVKSQLRVGDVVVTRRGYYAGRAAPVSESQAGWNSIDVLIIGCSESIDPAFLAHFLNSPRGRAVAEAYTTGTDLRFISANEFGRLRLPVPALRDQLETMARLTELQAGHEQLSLRVAQARAMEQAALSVALEAT